LLVGAQGVGSLSVSDHGFVHNTGSTVLGLASGSKGTVDVSAGSRLDMDENLFVGVFGSGAITISDGGSINTAGVTRIGGAEGSSGTVEVTGPGSNWTAGDLSIESAGMARLTIAADGVVINGSSFIASGEGTTGAVEVTGPGAVWNTVGLEVGGLGKGDLSIANGGRVTTGGQARVGGNNSEATSAVTVSGTSSVWEAGELRIGVSGKGNLFVEDGAYVTTRGMTTIGDFSGANGKVLLTGTGSRLSNDGMNVGRLGTGTLTIEKGASAINTGRAILGLADGSDGAALVTGAGSTWLAGTSVTVGLFGNGTLTVADHGVVNSKSTMIAEHVGSVGTLNIGSDGLLQTDSVTFGAGNGTINFDTVDDYSFVPVISGAGNLNFNSGQNVLTANSQDFTGKAQVADKARLSVNGVLGGSLDVLKGGFLGGIGAVGATTIEADGTLAPGNSIGTIHVNGDLTFKPGGIYSVEADAAGNSDKTEVAGVAVLTEGHVDVVASAGNWLPSTTYTILSAAGGLNGTTFKDVSTNLAFLDPTLTYDSENVTLMLKRNNLTIGGDTPNQEVVGDAIEDNGGTPNYTLLQRMLGLDKDTAARTIAQLPGEIHPSLRGVLLEDSHFIVDRIADRIRSAFDVASAGAPPVLSYGPDGAEEVAATTDRFAVWGQGFGSWADKKTNASVAGIDRSVGGFLIGGDAAVSDYARLGIVGGYSSTSLDEGSLDATASIDNMHLGAYGAASLGKVNLRAGGSYTWHDIDVDRHVQFTGFDEHLTAGYKGNTAQVFGEIGYSTTVSNINLEPFANLTYTNVHTDAFAETGGTAALAGAAKSDDVTFSTLGMHASVDMLELTSLDATLHGMAAWRHALGDIDPTSQMAFAGTDSFGISGLPIARDSAILETGIDFNVARNTSLGLTYQGQIASKAYDNSVRADFRVKF
jgi:subtilase-type serine protease